VPLWLAAVIASLFFGPIFHTVARLMRDHDCALALALATCLGSVLGNAWGVWTYRTRRGDKKLIADLKPEHF